MSFSGDNLEEYESTRGKGQFARVVESIDDQGNPANALVLRALTQAAELGDKVEERVSEIVASTAKALFASGDEIPSHSISHEEDVSMGGDALPFLPGWKLHVDFYAPDDAWSITSLEHVSRIEFMLYPQTEDDQGPESYPYINDVLCNLGPSVVFTRNIINRWAYDAVHSSLELRSQTEVLDFLTGLSEGIAASSTEG